MVNFLPSNKKTTEIIIKEGILSPEDKICDLGSGDGRIVIALSKAGFNASGIEKNKEMCEIALENAIKENVICKFINADFFEYDFLEEFDTVILYQAKNILEDLKWKLRHMKKVICIGEGIDDFEKFLTKKIDNKMVTPCFSINFYGDLDEFKDLKVNEILRFSNSFMEARKSREADETIYIYEIK